MNNATLDDATLVAFVDGELDETSRHKVELALGRDVEARRRVEAMRASARLLRGAYDEVFDRPLPARMQALLDAARPKPSGAPRRGLRDFMLGGRMIALGAACAASLALGVFVGRGDLAPVPDTTYAPASVETKAGGALLEAQVGVLENGADDVEMPYNRIDIGVGAAMTPYAAFEGPGGQVCRPYRDRVEHAAGAVMTVGIACRGAEGRWTALEFPATP